MEEKFAQALLDAIVAQRDAAMNEVAKLRAQLAVLQAQIEQKKDE